ncbi:hypothetical protein PRIPAC_71215, partial [Pristionchus pacificus]|uniref:Uncharacterized protein n=1 Tax=Pristionchus pacificus TaxID=54126 RepID=A0A2A6C590_PRIPA
CRDKIKHEQERFRCGTVKDQTVQKCLENELQALSQELNKRYREFSNHCSSFKKNTTELNSSFDAVSKIESDRQRLRDVFPEMDDEKLDEIVDSPETMKDCMMTVEQKKIIDEVTASASLSTVSIYSLTEIVTASESLTEAVVEKKEYESRCIFCRLIICTFTRSLDKTTDKQPFSLPAPIQDTYSVVKRALNDASTYAEKAKRAVWVGREELSTPDQTTSADQKAIESLCEELNDPHISDALKNGQIQHHRHPHEKGDRKRRILKIAFTDEKTRDKFLSLCRSSRPDTVTKTPGNFVRRDLCPYELDLERKARIDAYTMNCKLGALVYGIRDEKLIKFNGSNPRPLPSDYANRPPRGLPL